MRYHLSVLIPARNEYYHDIDLLHETITNVLANTSPKTEIIVVLDGYDNQWPTQPLPVDSRLTVIQHRKSIGQRAATNEAARTAQGEYVMKLDAHCALDSNFDEKLLATFEPHWTVVPGQYNLLVFEWKCKKCGWTKDQSPKPPKCESCGSRYLKQVKIWKPRDGKEGRRTAYTHSWRFDTNLDFAYWGAYTSDEKYCKKHGVPFRPEAQGQIHDTMSLLGACWAMTRKRYFEIEPCDPLFGSWGDMGTEISAKVWLSGGELKVNQNTWFAHFFRVGGLGFPYPDGGRKERAKARGKELWLKNLWPQQIYPLSWLIDRFSPVPDWDTPGNPVRAAVNKEGALFHTRFSSRNLSANTLAHGAASLHVPAMPSQVSETGVVMPTSASGESGSSHVGGVRDKGDVQRIATVSTITNNVVQLGLAGTAERDRLNQPCVSEAVNADSPIVKEESSVSGMVQSSCPEPAAGLVESNLRKETSKSDGVNVGNGKILDIQNSASSAGLRLGSESSVELDSGPSIVTQKRIRKTCLYYSCNSHDPALELAARNNLRRATNGHEIGCVTLRRTDFGDWTIVIDREKSGGTMHYQILAGLERSTADYVFLCESDVMYHQSHFDFTPPRDDTFYYNTNVWRVRYEDGHAVRTANLQQVSGICASRKLLLEHYRRRVEIIEQNDGKFDVKSMAYEPGTRGKFGDERVENWQSPYPNIDITGHGQTLTTPHFSVDSFRNKKYAEGWEETDDPLPGWPKIAGRVQEWLKELADESILR